MTKTKVIFITGQSNSEGRANSTLCTTEELVYHTNCKIWHNSNFTDLKVGPYGNNKSAPNNHGVELPLAMRFKETLPEETIYIVKLGAGGTNIDSHLPGGNIYEDFKNNYFQPAINWLINQGIIPEIYIYYSQGEAEANASRYLEFNKKLSRLIENYKNILVPEIKFIFPEIIESGSLTHDIHINNVFKNYEKNNSNVFVINGKNYPSDDNLHWNYEGVNLLGEDLFKFICDNSSDVVKYNLPYDFVSENIEVITKDIDYNGKIYFKNSTLTDFPFQNKGVVYIDPSLPNSNLSKINNKFYPFHNLSSALSSLPIDDNSTWIIHFLKGGIVLGAEVPFRNLEFFSEQDLTIDFTNVKQESEIIASSPTKASVNNIININFLSENIKIISNYVGIQRFTNNSPYLKISGSISFDWKSSGGNNASNYIFQCKVKTNLIIREWIAYSTHGAYILGFADGSTVNIKKIINIDLSTKYTFRETNFNILHNASIIIEEIVMQSGEFRSLIPIEINKITGTGVINSKSTKFNNCKCDIGITFNNLNATKVEGTLISDNYWKASTSGELLIKNFEGKANNISLTGLGKIITKGNTCIDTTTLITASPNDVVVFEVCNGITVLNGVLKTNNTSTFVEKGILKIN